MTTKVMFPSYDKVLGKNLPTPVFRSIELYTVASGEYEWGGVDDLEINATLSISLTKPDNELSTAQLLEYYFDNMYLYAYFSPFESINTRLQESNLNLRDLFDAYSDKALQPSSFYGPGHLAGAGSGASPTAVYEDVIAFQKQQFLKKFPSGWFSQFSSMFDHMPDEQIAGYSIEQARVLLEDPTREAIPELGVNVIYYMFWGDTGEAGPWTSDDLGAAFKTYMNSVFRYPTTNYSHMRNSLAQTLHLLVRGGYTGANYSWRHKISLADFADPGNSYGATIVEGQQYDEEGNEIVKISGINIKTFLNTSNVGSIASRLNNLEKVFSIAFVGLDIDHLGAATSPTDERSTSYGFGVPHLTEGEDGAVTGVGFGGDAGIFDLMPRRSLFNTYFGNIVYEHVLDKGVVVDKPTEAFYKISDQTQYDDIAIEAWDSRYYANEPVSREDIEKEMKKIITAASAFRKTDGELDLNLKNLEYILEINKNSSQIFMYFRDYMRTYSNKSPVSHSGKFYNNFKLLATKMNKAIMNQERLSKKVFKNTIVYDARSAIGVGSIASLDYVSPWVYSGAEFNAGSPDSPRDGTFLPTQWMRYTSNVVFKTSETTADRKEDSEWWNIYTIMLSLLAGGSAGRGSYRSGESKEEHKWGGDSSLEFRELDITNYFNIADAAAIDAISESWHTTHHYTWADLCALATEQTNKYFAANSEYGILGMHDYASADGAGGGYGSSADHRGNRVVINDGWFFFDWEKAMHTQSALAQFVSPSALNRFLGYRVPYRAFPVISVVLERRGAIYPFEVPTARCQMMLECRMHTPYNDYNPSTDSMVGSPRSAYSVHEVRGTLTPHSALQDFAFAEIDFHRPGGDISSPPTTKSYSYLKFVNFDTVNGDIYTGLKTLRNFAPWTPEFPYVPVALGSRPCGDYRLMAYNFRDIMDDDIAYYNATVGNKDPSSRSSLETRAADWLDGYNTTGEPFGEYIVKVACEDKSLEEIKKIERELVRPAIERFEEYAARANELCSYNNIENKFNTFFATGMESVYNVGTMPAFTTFAGAPDNQPPWFEIPYLIAAFYYTFGRQYKSPDIKNYDLEQQILDNAVIIAKMCNPRTGSLNGIISVRAMLQKLQDILLLQDSRSRDRIRQIVGDETITHIDDIFDMAYTGMSADSTTSTDDIDFSTFGGTVPSPCAVFFGSMNQDQPIFGDVMIDNADMFLDIEGLEEPPDVDAPFDPEDHEEHDTTCFVAGTMVKMADGTDKRIEDVEIGETLLGHNGVLNTVLEFDHPMLGNRQLYAINDGKPFITGDHPMRSTDGWKAIYPEGTENNARHTVELHRDHGVETTQLLPGDKLILIDGNLIQVHSITAHDAQPQRLYNFMLDGNHTYYADGYLVHNACAGDDGPEGEAGVPMKQCKDEDGSIIAEVAITAPCPPGTSSDTDMFEVAADTEADTEALEG